MPKNLVAVESVTQRILLIRDQKVMLDADLAELFGVPTKVFNQAITRNLARFPADFMFRLTGEEYEALRSQFVTLKTGRGQHRKYLPYVFTEHGAIMAATILNSPKAVEMSVYIVRAFVQLREMLSSNKAVVAKLLELERKVSGHDQAIVGLMDAVNAKLAQRFVRPLARRNQQLIFSFASSPACGRGLRRGHFRERVGERETGMANFTIKGDIFAMPVRQLMAHPSGTSRPIGFTADINQNNSLENLPAFPLCKRGTEGDFYIRATFKSPLAPLFQRGECFVAPRFTSNEQSGIKVKKQMRSETDKRQRGFSLVSAIFLLVVIAALGTFAVTLSTTQQQGAALDVMGARAYQAARVGIEWGAYQVLPNSAAAFATTCRGGGASQPVAPLPNTLSGFNVNVGCTASASSEAGATVTMYQLTSTASAVVTSGSVERQMSVTIAN